MPKKQSSKPKKVASDQVPLRVLFAEDVPSDVKLCLQQLKTAGFKVAVDVVQTPQEFAERLRSKEYDVVLSDFNLPSWTVLDALHILKQERKDIPIIVVAGAMGEESAVECIKKGVWDYVHKDRLSRLPIAVRRALEESTLRHERNQAIEELRVQDANFRLLFANNPHPMWVWDLDTLRFLEVNDAAIAQYGYTREEFLEMGMTDIRPPEDVDRLLQAIRGPRPAVKLHLQWRHRLKDGRIIDVESSSHLLSYGSKNALLVVSQDITERKRAEEGQARLAAILEATSDYVGIADPHGNVIYMNGGGKKMLGLGKNDDFPLRSIADSHPEWARKLILQEGIPKAIHDGSWSGENAFLALDGKEIPVSQVILAHKSRDGTVKFFSTIARDITERKRAQQELEMRNREVEHATHMKSQFLASMSHDLRTPLNAILGFSGLLADGAAGELNEKQAHYVGFIQSGGQHLLRLVNDILDLSKIEAGKLELNRESVSVADALPEVLTLIRPLAMAKKIHLETAVEVGLLVMADRIRLKQVLYNLLSNAVKFTPEEGSIWVEASTDAGFAWISVRDNGIGISSEHQDSIFEEFFQVGTNTKGLKEGTGLGLAICRRLAEQHGGKIWVESTSGQGSCFTFSLPLAASAPNPPAARPIHAPGISRRVKPLILIVEDDFGARELLASYLEPQGYETAFAGSNAEAVAQALMLAPDVITLDMLTPGKPGWETLRQLKNTPATAPIPVIIVSVVDQRKMGFSLGAADYLVKPVSKEVLLHTVTRHLGPHQDDSPPVLVVDDEPESLHMVTEVLKSAGYTFLAANGGREALKILETTKPGVMLLDLMMPDVDGFQVIQAVRGNPDRNDIPIIVITAKDLSEPEIEILTRETRAFLSKSSSWKPILLAQIRQALGRSQIEL